MERKQIENKHRLLETHGMVAKEPAVILLESQKQRKEGLKDLKPPNSYSIKDTDL